MSSISPDGARAEITENALKEGNPVKTSAGAVAGTREFLFTDENGQLQSASGFPFPIVVTDVVSTQAAFLDLTARTTLSEAEILHETIVAGASTSLTTTGFLRIKLTDSAGNLTDGYYFIPFGTLA